MGDAKRDQFWCRYTFIDECPAKSTQDGKYDALDDSFKSAGIVETLRRKDITVDVVLSITGS